MFNGLKYTLHSVHIFPLCFHLDVTTQCTVVYTKGEKQGTQPSRTNLMVILKVI